jgi:hypothetical protein
MKKLILKVHRYVPDEQNLIVSFASDETKSQNPEDYPELAFNPFNLWPEVSDMSQIPLLLARAGIYYVEMQAKKEATVYDEKQQEQLKNLAGQTLEYSLTELDPKPFKFY